ncbi:hypothetical protein DL96DRAFT_1587622 [Flagelloscypha sp. PMI_526]|nr:hypothetical protein DL96DRAFT_1587622 [Flagelloscypha sp. PMI_526]
MADGPIVPGAFVSALAPIFFGFPINIFLNGVLIVQVYIYSIAFPKDPWTTKAIVYVVLLLELLQTALMMQNKYQAFVVLFGTTQAIEEQGLGWFIVPVLTSITAAIVQGFFGYRILILSSSWVPACAVWLTTLLQLASGLAQGILSIGLPNHELALRTKSTVIVWTVSTAVTDVLVAALLSHYLFRMRSGIEETNSIVGRIVQLTIGTGSLTAVAAVLILILVFLAPPWFSIFTDFTSKLYSNSLMVTFNRRMILGSSQRSGVHTIPDSGGHQRHESVAIRVQTTIDTGVWELEHRGKPMHDDV